MEFTREFFYDEVRDGFYIPGIVKRLWGAGLTILSEIDRICKKYNIPYYADGGTLLGAVRDGQFIPWDDDIDIIMRREDFKRFSLFAKKELPAELDLESLELNTEYSNFTAHLGKKNTDFRPELLRKYQEYPYPETIDIFILDELAQNPEDEEFREKVLMMLGGILKYDEKYGKTERLLEELEEIENVLKIRFDREKSLKEQLFRVMDRVCQEFNGTGSDMLAIVPWTAYFGIYSYPRSAFEKSNRIPFCNTEVPAPIGYDTVLRAEYGDYHKKVKAGGEHSYPYFKIYEDELREKLKEGWIFTYHFSEEDLLRPKIENLRDIVMHMAEVFAVSQKELFKEYERGEIQACLQRLSKAQEDAIAFGDAIEQKKGEGSESVSVLEKYCEALYQAYMALREVLPMEDLFLLSATVHKELKQKLKKPGYYLKKLRSALEKDFKRQVVFLSHSAKHFESLRPLVDALLQAGDTECKIIPIPYYDRYGDGSLKEMHYEGDAFPKEYEITDYRNYNFAAELPDCIVINSPYDEFNQVWTVDSAFYSREMKKYTNKLVYIPWFVTDEINPKDEEDGKAFYNMKYYVEVPGIFHSDLSIVQSEGMKKAYLSKISKFAGTAVRKRMSKKISGAGSCLLGEKERQGTKELVERFRRYLFKT